jgi:hypothetical protein
LTFGKTSHTFDKILKPMQVKYLFPSKYKKFGWIILIPAAILGVLDLFMEWEPAFLDWRVPAIYMDEILGETTYFGWIENNVLNEMLAVLVILGSILVAFSKQRNEDEFISKIRLESLVWATYTNYIVLLLAFLFVFEMGFLWVMIFNMFTILLFFIIRFNWQIQKMKSIEINAE